MPRLFGTDGVRGVAGTELDRDLAVALGRAAVRKIGSRVLIGRDSRVSGPMLEDALVAGIRADEERCRQYAETSPSLATALNPHIGYDKAAAIAYLQRKDLPEVPPGKGWQLAAYQGHPLGWMNVLPNRVNNYYPRDLRILKDSPGAGTGKNSTSL